MERKRPFHIASWKESAEGFTLTIIEEEYFKFLKVLGSPKEIIGFAAIGRARSGKSTGMNLAVVEIINKPHERFEIRGGCRSFTNGIFVDIYSSMEVNKKYEFLSNGDERKILFFDTEGTKGDGGIIEDLSSLVSTSLSTHCFIYVERVPYDGVKTFKNMKQMSENKQLEKYFLSTNFAVLIKNHIEGPDDEEDMETTKKEFEGICPSIYWVAVPASPKDAVYDRTEFYENMIHAIETEARKIKVIPYNEWIKILEKVLLHMSISKNIEDINSRFLSPKFIKIQLLQLQQYSESE